MKLLPCPFCGDEGEKGSQNVSQMKDVLPPLENPHSYRTAANAYTIWENAHAEENRKRTSGVRNTFTRITCRVCGAMCPETNWNQRFSSHVVVTDADLARAYNLALKETASIVLTGDSVLTPDERCARFVRSLLAKVGAA